jgi:broad specificity phosphatase PhoE
MPFLRFNSRTHEPEVCEPAKTARPLKNLPKINPNWIGSNPIQFYIKEKPLIDIPENCVIYLARHADPDRTRPDIPYHIPPGPELTEKGRAQAIEMGAFLHDEDVKHILSSPLERSWQTARIVGEICSATLEINLDLAEMRMDELQTMVTERMSRGFKLALQLAAVGSPVAMISHGAPILALIKELGLDRESVEKMRVYDSRNLIPVGGIWEIRRGFMGLVFAPEGIEIKKLA